MIPQESFEISKGFSRWGCTNLLKEVKGFRHSFVKLCDASCMAAVGKHEIRQLPALTHFSHALT